ncbi:hypothetical protein ASPBRDRAFT_191213 [Aspergillus brasiliensis CBS 101740]|uniref:Fungal-type protein kinase domain-containing protein n=1 Tax=Aspergillus brasiliensis (strain CBS 101740 / IMI 381727 / IBT 21946) TaxID=767769 RepID=A0A1L9V2B1_ASPBC|nr:hypothetical protein ASPBRDRAFT_191213 [Aspergillus brasiliensis CBS 101740]
MSYLILPRGQRERIWSPLPELVNEEKFRTLRPGGSEFKLKAEQVVDWTDFTAEVKRLVTPFCGANHAFTPVIPSENFGVANEIGVQGRFVQNALHPVGEILNLLRIGVAFGDSQFGVNRVQDDKKKKRGHAERQTGKKPTTLVPDIVLVERQTHAIRALAEVKTYWAFLPKLKQTWDEFIADKLGQLARYMDDHFCRFGFYTIYENTWFVKRVDDTHFAVSEAISSSAKSTASDVSLRECLLATAIRAADKKGSYYGVRYGKKLTEEGHTFTRISARAAKFRKTYH